MKTQNLKINEIFYSLQGESSRIGIPTTFIRLTGCPMRCNYCDTAYAFSEGKNLTFFPKSITVLSNLPKNCETYNSDLIQDRFYKYQNTSKPSFSIKYLNSLVSRNEIPDPKLFDIRKICSEVNLN